eukprot:13155679-Alexandrium_andersonii.AAC.1
MTLLDSAIVGTSGSGMSPPACAGAAPASGSGSMCSSITSSSTAQSNVFFSSRGMVKCVSQ